MPAGLPNLLLNEKSASVLARQFNAQSNTVNRLRILSIIAASAPSPETISLLFIALRDSKPAVRATALKILAEHDPANVGRAALLFLDDEHPYVRQQAIEILGDLDTPGMDILLLNKLNDPLPWVRFTAVKAVCRQRLSGAADAIESLLLDEHPRVRQAACEAFALDFPPGPVDTLIACLRDEDEGVRFWAIEALRAAGERTGDVMEGLLECLHDRERSVQVRSVQCIRYLGLTEAIPHLRMMMVMYSDLTSSIYAAITSLEQLEVSRMEEEEKVEQSLSPNGHKGEPLRQPAPLPEQPARQPGLRRAILRVISRLQRSAEQREEYAA